jgi:hypothetical protein
MAFSPNLEDRELTKFVESPSRPGNAAVEVVGNLTQSSGPFDPPLSADTIVRSVSGAIETYTYRQGGPTGTILKTITVTYHTASLNDLHTVEVS